MSVRASIIISSHNRIGLLRRSLWSLANRGPSFPFELVVADEGSTDDILGELELYSAAFPWTFVRFSAEEFQKQTGIRKWFNNPSATNNAAYKHTSPDSQLIFHMGNEIIPMPGCFDQLVKDKPDARQWIVFSTTYDCPPQFLDLIDRYGTNWREEYTRECSRWPLQSTYYPSDVTNYVSLAPRSLWERIKGYDERYVGGISADDSDFVRRARAAGAVTTVSSAISIHQSHNGRTRYYLPPPTVITQERWDEGARLNRVVYDAWNKQPENPQPFPWGTYGVTEVIRSIDT